MSMAFGRNVSTVCAQLYEFYFFFFLFFLLFFFLSAAPSSSSSYFHGYFARARLTCSGRREGRKSAKGSTWQAKVSPCHGVAIGASARAKVARERMYGARAYHLCGAAVILHRVFAVLLAVRGHLPRAPGVVLVDLLHEHPPSDL